MPPVQLREPPVHPTRRHPGYRDRVATEETVEGLLDQLDELTTDDPARDQVRERIITLCLPMARRLAGKYRNRGEPADDLDQVAVVGLIKAVDSFDRARGPHFTGYALPTIIGELRRYFRDRTWDVQVPRRLRQLRQPIRSAAADLFQRNGRKPTVADIAHKIGISEDSVVEALYSAAAYRSLSLDGPDGPGGSVVEGATADNADLARVELRHILRPALAALPERERRIIVLRFFGELSQAEIGAQVGLSQMHVSRLINQSLTRMRSHVAPGLDTAA